MTSTIEDGGPAFPRLYIGAQNDALYVIDGPPSPGTYDGPIPKKYGPNVIAGPFWSESEKVVKQLVDAWNLHAALKRARGESNA